MGSPMNQYAARFASMGVRVSPVPRSAPVVQICMPSNNWKAAATNSRVLPTSITVGSGEKIRARVLEKLTKTIAEQVMKPAPRIIADHPARRAASESPRPISCPTRTAAAELIPSGTMKVSEAQLSAIS